MISADEARALVEGAVQDGADAEKAQPGTGPDAFGRSLVHRVRIHVATQAAPALCPPLDRSGLADLAASFELNITILGLACLAWTFWVLEAKGVWHYGRPDDGWRYVLEEQVIGVLEGLLLAARNLGVQTKRDERGSGQIPSNVNVPPDYTDWRNKIGTLRHP